MSEIIKNEFVGNVGERSLNLKKKKDEKAAERLRRLLNKNFRETEVEISLQYEKSIKNHAKDRQ